MQTPTTPAQRDAYGVARCERYYQESHLAAERAVRDRQKMIDYMDSPSVRTPCPLLPAHCHVTLMAYHQRDLDERTKRCEETTLVLDHISFHRQYYRERPYDRIRFDISRLTPFDASLSDAMDRYVNGDQEERDRFDLWWWPTVENDGVVDGWI